MYDLLENNMSFTPPASPPRASGKPPLTAAAFKNEVPVSALSGQCRSALPGARVRCACAPAALLGSRRDLCLFWQGRESQETQSKPLNLLTVWDWSVQFEPKAQMLLRNPLYVEKPKLDKGQRKGVRSTVRCLHA